MKRLVLFSVLSCLLCFFDTTLIAQEAVNHVEVSLRTDAGWVNATMVRSMEQTLSRLLTEINSAYIQQRDFRVGNLPMDPFAKEAISTMLEEDFYFCDDSKVIAKLWPLRDGFMVRQIPLIEEQKDKGVTSKRFKYAVAEFDRKGVLVDFVLASDVEIGESLEKGGDTVDVERRRRILRWCDQLCAAYNKKDIGFLDQVFSEDALIITGTVITPKTREFQLPPRVVYSVQSKQTYLENLKKCFARNERIEVKFSPINPLKEKIVTRSPNNSNMYGVRLRQEWRSSGGYSDQGYLFLLWDFTDEDRPVIHVRTWQPEWVGDHKLLEEEIFSVDDF